MWEYHRQTGTDDVSPNAQSTETVCTLAQYHLMEVFSLPLNNVIFNVPPCHHECKRRAHLTHMGDHVWTMLVVTRFSGVHGGAYASYNEMFGLGSVLLWSHAYREYACTPPMPTLKWQSLQSREKALGASAIAHLTLQFRSAVAVNSKPD